MLPQRAVRERIDQGHALLADRMCRGGWLNYGNKAVLGFGPRSLPGYDALALLALQDHRSQYVTALSVDRLASLLRDNRSTAGARALRTGPPEIRAERRKRANGVVAPAYRRWPQLRRCVFCHSPCSPLQDQHVPLLVPYHG